MSMEPWSRREVLVTGLATGFASAVLPVHAEVITTDAKGLVVGEVKVPVGESTIPAYQAKPEGAGPFPVILVVQEIFGVHEHLRDVCRRFAKMGYFAIAPELYARQGDVSKLTKLDEIFKIVQQVPDKQVLGDLDATLAYAAKAGGNVDKAGITGFCWGGRIVWLYANYNPKLRAGVAWYGRLTGTATELQPKYPLDIVPTLRVPVLGLYAGEDKGISLASVEQMKQALRGAQNNPSEIVVYPEASHGFYADYRPSYNEKAAQDGWQRLKVWFQKYGVG